MRELISTLKKERQKAQEGNELSNILPKLGLACEEKATITTFAQFFWVNLKVQWGTAEDV